MSIAKWKGIQFIIGTSIDGIPGPKDEAALEAIKQSAKQERASTVKREIGFMDGSPIYQLGNVVSFRGGMNINADGSPRAYGPNGHGLDYLGNAGSPGNWWGIATDASGKPYVQGIGDPFPGHYVSTTAMADRRYEINDPRRYVNSETVPFIVLPSNFPVKVPLGTKARVTYRGKSVDGIYADIGPRFQLGEASIAMANKLGINSDPKRGGTKEEMLYEVFLPTVA